MNVLGQKVNDAYAAEMLNQDEAVRLDFCDLATKKQSILRGRGWVRVNFTTGLSNNVIAAGAVRQRNGAVLTLYQDAGGSVYMQAAVRPASADSDYT